MDYYRAQRQLAAQLQSDLTAISRRVAVNIVGPLWDMNTASARNVLESEMSNRNLFAAVVSQNDKIVVGVGRDDGQCGCPG